MLCCSSACFVFSRWSLQSHISCRETFPISPNSPWSGHNFQLPPLPLSHLICRLLSFLIHLCEHSIGEGKKWSMRRFGGLMPLFFLLYYIFFHIYNTFTHSYIHEHSLRLLSIPSSLNSSVADTSLSAESGFELGPALQRADVLPVPTEPCRTLTEPCRHPCEY